MEKIVDIIKDNKAIFMYAVSGVLYYKIETDTKGYIFPVDMNDKADIGEGKFLPEHNAITLMRWLRKAIDNNSVLQYDRK